MPALRCLLNLATLDDLPGPKPDFETIAAAGYDGVQFVTEPNEAALRACRRLDLLAAGSGRVNTPFEVREIAGQTAGAGLLGATLHVGWGMENDDEAHALIEAILEASDRLKIGLWPETHRATIFQDLWRTVNFVRRFPTLTLNGDFSHWYTGLEMVYGGFENKLHFIEPVFPRIRFLHGRIGNPGCIQVAVSEDPAADQPYVGHFRQLWTASIRGFLATAKEDAILPFAAELLSPRIYYGRVVPSPSGQFVEEADRWAQSLLLCELARDCWGSAIQLPS